MGERKVLGREGNFAYTGENIQDTINASTKRTQTSIRKKSSPKTLVV